MAQRKTSEAKIAELEKKQSQIKARITKERAKVRTTSRRQNTRRKIIAGALALKHMNNDPQFSTTMKRLLSEGIKREEDKALFSEIE